MDLIRDSMSDRSTLMSRSESTADEPGGELASETGYAQMGEEGALQVPRSSTSVHERVSMPNLVKPEDANFVWGCTLLALMAALTPFVLVPLLCAEEVCNGRLPIYLSLAYTLFCAYLFGRVSTAAQLPNVLGYLCAGFIFQYLQSDKTASASPTLQTLVFALGVLVRAGLELDFKDMNYITVPLGILPVMADGLTVAVCAMSFLDYSFVEAGALGFIIAPLGDGMVIPAMLELKVSESC
jgi:hypothetical protein